MRGRASSFLPLASSPQLRANSCIVHKSHLPVKEALCPVAAQMLPYRQITLGEHYLLLRVPARSIVRMTTPQEVLAQVSLFSTLSKKDLTHLAASAHDQHFAAGKVLTEEDQTGVVFGVIAEGQASVNVGGKQARILGPGDFFGEMALIDRTVRSATVTADTDVRCLLFTQWVFRPFAVEHPEVAWALLELMVKRVREAENR
jgi:hypothetical protein